MLRGWTDGPLLHPTVVVDAAALPYVLASDRAMVPPCCCWSRTVLAVGCLWNAAEARQNRREGTLLAVTTRVRRCCSTTVMHYLSSALGAGRSTTRLRRKSSHPRSTQAIALIDTAADCGNESGVGAALKRVRNQFYITTKLRNEDQGYDRTMRAFDASSVGLQLDLVDLYLIHWPCPQRRAYIETWRALIELQKRGTCPVDWCIELHGRSSGTHRA